jgi:hypothetical protein
VITGASAKTYTLVTADVGANITFEVTPVATTGVLTGTAVVSAAIGPIKNASECPCSVWDGTALPAVLATHDDDAASLGIELGMKFLATEDGSITGIRFYKSSQNTGIHTGSLWSANGALLSQVTFTGETASGWQEAMLATPVAVTAGVVYVVSYHAPVGYYSSTSGYFVTTGVDSGPLHALKNGESGGNGLYRYGAIAFPSDTFNSSNYWVDVVFSPAAAAGGGVDVTPPKVTGRVPAASATGVSTTAQVTASFSESLDPVTVSDLTFELRDAGNNLVSAQITYDAGQKMARLSPLSALASSATYTATLRGGATGSRITDAVGNALAANVSWSFTTAAANLCPCSIWDAAAQPALLASDDDPGAIELGMKFRASQNGYITAIRFYKSSQNTGTHTGSLWSASGTVLGRVTFASETVSGWQEATLATPIAVTAGTVYVVSYHTPVGYYSATSSYFTSTGVDKGPLRALQNGESGGNGLYRYGANAFPTESYNGSNYWVDVVFTP